MADAASTQASSDTTSDATPGVRATAASLEPSLPAWDALHLALESGTPLVRSPEYIARSNAVFAANRKPDDLEAWTLRLADSLAEFRD